MKLNNMLPTAAGVLGGKNADVGGIVGGLLGGGGQQPLAKPGQHPSQQQDLNNSINNALGGLLGGKKKQSSDRNRSKTRKPPHGRLSFCRFYCQLDSGVLQQSLFQLLLALNAVPRPRNRFQAFGIDLLAAGDALSKRSFANAAEGAFHHLQ